MLENWLLENEIRKKLTAFLLQMLNGAQRRIQAFVYKCFFGTNAQE